MLVIVMMMRYPHLHRLLPHGVLVTHHPGHERVLLSERDAAQVEEEVEDLVLDDEVSEPHVRVTHQTVVQGVQVIWLLPTRVHHATNTNSSLNKGLILVF